MQRNLAVVLLALTASLPAAVVRGQSATEPAPPTQPSSPPTSAATTQPTTSPATQPGALVSQPTTAEAPKPLRSPASMMANFRAALRAAPEHPERLADALACLDFAQLDPEVAKEEGPSYARQLGEIIDHLVKAGDFKPENLPDDPAAETQVIGKDPVLLVLERNKHRLWQFAPSTVAEIPRLYETPPAGATSATTVESEPASEPALAAGVVPEGLSTPRALLTHFLVTLNDAKTDPDRYPDVLACLSFAAVEAPVAQDQGVEYAEQLGDILQRLLDAGVLKLDDLPDDPEAETQTIGKDPVLLILNRGDDSRWRFAGRTVAQVPTLLAKLRESPAQAGAEEAARSKPATAAAGASSVPAEFHSPRATIETFFRAMSEDDLRTAVRCLDLSELTAAERDAKARLLAGKLLLVMVRHAVVVFQELPDEPDAESPDKYMVGRFGRIEIGRESGGERAGEWLFTPVTVRSIDRLYESWETRPVLAAYRNGPGVSFLALPSLWLREHVIPASLKRSGLGLQYWQWLGIALVLLAGYLVRGLANRWLPWLVRRLVQRRAAPEFKLDPGLLKPFALLALMATWWAGVQLLDLQARAIGLLWLVMRLVLVVFATWALYRFIDVLTDYSAAHAARREHRLNDVLVPLARKTLKVVIVAIGATMVLTVLGFEVGPLLAGLGIGGLAFSFAAKDTIANFFGSVNVVLDRPFQVGDWVKIGNYEGTIESVGLRSSRLRTFHDSQLNIPNAEIMTAFIDNMGRRRFRRTHFTIAVTYATTAEQLEAFCEGMRELIRRHPHTRKDNFQVYTYRFAPAAIEIELYCFHEVPDWSTELRERHRLIVDVLRLARRLGVELTFPSQTDRAPAATPGAPATAVAPPPPDPSATSESVRAAAQPGAGRFVRGDTEGALALGRAHAAAIVATTNAGKVE